MKEWIIGIIAICAVMTVFSGDVVADSGSRIGGGVHYWVAMDDIDTDDVDENGFAYMFSYQYSSGALVLFEANLEVFPEDMTGTDENLYAPQAFVLLGGAIYGGLGAGYFYYDGEFSDDPFYILRAGLNLELLPSIYLDINANYHFTDIGEIDEVSDEIDTDTMTVGAMLRFAL